MTLVVESRDSASRPWSCDDPNNEVVPVPGQPANKEIVNIGSENEITNNVQPTIVHATVHPDQERFPGSALGFFRRWPRMERRKATTMNLQTEKVSNENERVEKQAIHHDAKHLTNEL